MMDNPGRVAKNLQAFRIAVNSHDRENPTHTPAYGVALSPFDLDRLGFDDGEELWPGVTIHADQGCTGNFRVLCDGEHDNERQGQAEERVELARAVGAEA
jgi:hypothetical protein